MPTITPRNRTRLKFSRPRLFYIRSVAQEAIANLDQESANGRWEDFLRQFRGSFYSSDEGNGIDRLSMNEKWNYDGCVWRWRVLFKSSSICNSSIVLRDIRSFIPNSGVDSIVLIETRSKWTIWTNPISCIGCLTRFNRLPRNSINMRNYLLHFIVTLRNPLLHSSPIASTLYCQRRDRTRV